MDARVKLLVVLTYCVCVVTTPAGQRVALALYAAILAIGLVAHRAVLRDTLAKVGRALPILIMLVVLLPFFRPGEPLWRWGAVSVSVEGLRAAVVVAYSALLCVTALALLTATTPVERLLAGLRGIGVPAALCGVIAFMLRYVHVLRPELRRLRDARDARTIGAGGPGAIRSGANLIGALAIRAFERAEHVADAMAARGYTGSLRMYRAERVRAVEVAFGTSAIAVFVLIRALGAGVHV